MPDCWAKPAFDISRVSGRAASVLRLFAVGFLAFRIGRFQVSPSGFDLVPVLSVSRSGRFRDTRCRFRTKCPVDTGNFLLRLVRVFVGEGGKVVSLVFVCFGQVDGSPGFTQCEILTLLSSCPRRNRN